MYFDEHIPDCVPEFYRAQQEEQERREDRLMQEQEHYQANREKIQAAIASGLSVLDYGGYGPCGDCPHADHDTQTDAEDDFDTVICHNPACRCHRDQAGGST